METNAKTDYDKQAESFLTRFGIWFQAQKAPFSSCPPWAGESTKADGYACIRCRSVHGDRFTVTLTKVELGVNWKDVRFPFWNSFHDATTRPYSRPSAYDVLACLSRDVHCPARFEEWCAEYGYDTDSRKALKTFERCLELSEKLKAFFSRAEIEALQEIR